MSRILTKEEWQKRKRGRRILMILAAASVSLIILVFSVIFIIKVFTNRNGIHYPGKETITNPLSSGEVIKLDYLSPNKYSRPQTRLKKVNSIVVHYTANPGTSAENNRSYFESLKWKKTTYASSHFIIGMEGEIIQCIPLTEVSYASNNRNKDTISIECCIEDETGEFNHRTYASLVALTAALCSEFGLEKEDIIRHYDVTGKLCPLYYVEHEDKWEAFKQDVETEVNKIYAVIPVGNVIFMRFPETIYTPSFCKSD